MAQRSTPAHPPLSPNLFAVLRRSTGQHGMGGLAAQHATPRSATVAFGGGSGVIGRAPRVGRRGAASAGYGGVCSSNPDPTVTPPSPRTLMEFSRGACNLSVFWTTPRSGDWYSALWQGANQRAPAGSHLFIGTTSERRCE